MTRSPVDSESVVVVVNKRIFFSPLLDEISLPNLIPSSHHLRDAGIRLVPFHIFFLFFNMLLLDDVCYELIAFLCVCVCVRDLFFIFVNFYSNFFFL